MSGKASKRNQAAEIAEDDSDQPSIVQAAFSLLSAHRWKAVAAAVVAVVGLAIGTGLVGFGSLSSWMAQPAAAPGETAVAETSEQGATPSASPVAAKPKVASAPELKTCFTPEQDCTAMIVAAIDGAQAEILVQAYSLTAKPLVKALGRAHTRGVKVRVILDKADERKGDRAGSLLIAQRILPQVDTGVVSAHNKVMIIDRDSVVTGSFNFTDAAQKKNAENVLLIKGYPDVVAAYAENWERRLEASRPYFGTMAPVL